jgi:hypothetical protein
MNYYAAREKMAKDGSGTGLWHYTVQNDDHIYPVGYCAQNCAGHGSVEEACNHYRLYLLDLARYDGTLRDTQRKCEICGYWTQTYAYIPKAMETHYLCTEHLNRDALDSVMHQVQYSIES